METQNKQYTLDFSNCRYMGELYAVIKKELALPEWFGNNLSAFWDCLTGMLEVPATIIFLRHAKNEDLLTHIDQLISVARRAETEEALGITVLVREL